MQDFTPEQLNKLEKGVKFLEDKDLTAFEQREEMIDVLTEIKDKKPAEMPEFPTEMTVKIAGVQVVTLKGDKGDKPIAGVDYEIPKNGKDYILTEKDKKEIASKVEVPIVEKIIEKIEVVKEQPIITQEVKEVAKFETAEEIKNKLETLKDDERLSIEAIHKLREELDELKKSIAKKSDIIYSGGSSGGGRIVKSYDLSASLNGVTKTFTLPAFYRVISVHSSSFPNALRETVDWTTSASNMSITFTDEITADTTLATGQTITIIYSE